MRLSNAELHNAFLHALGDLVIENSDPKSKPLNMTCRHPLPRFLRLYLFNLTHPPGGRTPGEHKIQLIVPGQARGQRGHFDHSGGYSVLVVGCETESMVYVLWDSGLYQSFAYSSNLQVKLETVCEALAGAISTQRRVIRGAGVETVVATPENRLVEAINLRMDLSLERLLFEGK